MSSANGNRNGTWGAFGKKQFPSSFGKARNGPSRDYYTDRDRQKVDELRKKEDDEKKSSELNEVNFPSLGSSFGGGPTATTGHTWSKSGSSLAKAWSEANDEQKLIEKVSTDQQRKNDIYSKTSFIGSRPPPSYDATSYYEENQYEEEDEDREKESANPHLQ